MLRSVTKNFRKPWLCMNALLLWLAPCIANAFPFVNNPADQSLKYLSQIFGGTVGSVFLGNGSSPALSEMIGKFNGWFLVVSIVILSYVILTSTINTAQQGEIFGRNMSSIWEPTKATIGILLLLPYPGSHYSLMQTTTMWAIVQGVGAANKVWQVSLDYLVQDMSPGSVTVEKFGTGSDTFTTFKDGTVPILKGDTTRYDNSIYKNVLCTATATSIDNGSIALNEKPATGYNDKQLAQASVDMGYTIERRDLFNPGGNLSELTVTEFTDNYPELSEAYNLSTLTDQQLQGIIFAGLSSATSLKYPSPVVSLGSRFKPYKVIPRENGGDLVISWSGSGSERKGSVTSYVKFGMQEASGDIASYQNVCGQVEIVTEVKASEVNASSSPQAEQDILIRDKLDIAVDGKTTAVESAALKLQELIKQVVVDLVLPRDYSGNKVTPQRPNGTFKSGSQGEPNGYVLAARNAINGNLSLLLKTKNPNGHKDIAELLKVTGWSTAGMTYFLFSQEGSSNNNYLSTTDMAPTITPATPSSIFSSTGEYSEMDAFNDRETDLKAYLNSDNSANINKGNDFQNAFDKASAPSNPVIRAMTSGFDGVTKMWADMTTGDGSSSPLVKIAKLGQELLLSAEIIWIVLVVLMMIMGFLSAGTFYGNPMFGVVNSMLDLVYSPVISICVLMWSIGAMLGVWIPLVPYLMFTAALLGWMILVIEAVICSQLVGLSIVIPGGEEIGKSKTGLTIILNIAMRPTLMVFGFFLATRLFTTFVVYLNFGLGQTLNSIWQLHPMIARFILPLFVYMGMVMAADTQCYRLIHALPDKILKWMGGPEENDGVKLVEDVRGIFDKGSSQITGGMNAIASKAQSFTKGKQEQAAKQNASEAG